MMVKDLSRSLESMGTTFIKLGQFLATRPDIIGEELIFKTRKTSRSITTIFNYEAKEIIKKIWVMMLIIQ